jgi:3-hydroxyisobutyrate dehydrogenase and related beta-hydroxyacid dehydrogenases
LEAGFRGGLQQKDLDLVLEYARDLGVPLFATGMISQLYAQLQKQGKGELGNHSLIQALEPLTGVSGFAAK